MKNLTLSIVFLTSVFANAQGQFEQGMGKAMQLWGEGKNTEASAMFERIATAEKSSWLPNYYVAAVNAFAAFGEKDKDKMNGMITKAQAAIEIELAKDANNPEILAMQAMVYTALISADPMTNGMKFSGKVMEIYAKAYAIAPKNPRVVFGKADFAIGGAKWTGANVKELCKDVDTAVELFKTFKPETPFSPNWGMERALQSQKTCKQ
jgi:hypothetical protein